MLIFIETLVSLLVYYKMNLIYANKKSHKEDSKMSNSKCKRYRLRFNRRSDNGIETTYIPFEEINDAFVIVVIHINEKVL